MIQNLGGYRLSMVNRIKSLLTSLDISEVNTVWTWGDKRPPTDKLIF